MTCPMGQGEVSFDLSQSQLGQPVLVPVGQAQLVQICLSHWDRLCLSQWLVPVGQARYRHHPSKVSPWPSLGWFLIKNQRGPNQILEIPYQKSVWNCSKILTKNRIGHVSITRITMQTRGASRWAMRKSRHHLHLGRRLGMTMWLLMRSKPRRHTSAAKLVWLSVMTLPPSPLENVPTPFIKNCRLVPGFSCSTEWGSWIGKCPSKKKSNNGHLLVMKREDSSQLLMS